MGATGIAIATIDFMRRYTAGDTEEIRSGNRLTGGAGWLVALALLLLAGTQLSADAATVQRRYYAHDATEDSHGVIVPWYRGQNGLVDLRVRVAAEFLKRYPWVGNDQSVMAGPHWIFNARVDLDGSGKIAVLPATDSMNGNLGQRFKYITESLPRYYRYTGDAAALGYLKIAADFLLDNYMTPADHPWPRFPISVPVRGKPYGPAEPGGYIQLDLSAGIGLGLIRAHQLTGETRYLDAAKHMGDVFAARCDRRPGAQPWGRYANPEQVPWGRSETGNRLTGGVANILIFLDELLRLGYTGREGAIQQAHDAGQAYLRDVLLPAWTADDTWGRHYWDWEHPVQGILPTGWVVQYLMDHQDTFPGGQQDVRNLLGLYLHRACVSPQSNGDVYSGAWAYPEGPACCGRSLDFCPVFLGRFWARYAAETGSPWAREIARRKTILGFYHFDETGRVEDNIDGGQITAREWSELIGFGPILCGLEIMAWLPEIFGPARENHIVRSGSLVTSVVYEKGRVEYSTYDAATGGIDVLRLAFHPESVTAAGETLQLRPDLTANGYSTKPLSGGDCLVSIRHDRARSVVITGNDPQQAVDDAEFHYQGSWNAISDPQDSAGSSHVGQVQGATAVCQFQGNQVRLIGRVTTSGGLADVWLDGVKQPVGIDCWTPLAPRHRQVLYYRNGLSAGPHELQIVVRGEKNPYACGTNVHIDGLQYSTETVPPDFGSGGGPTGAQRMIFGYPSRKPYVDSAGNEWLPATELVVRTGHNTDPVTQTWWTNPPEKPIAGTADPELYRYGVHAPEFWVNLTVGPGVYRVCMKFAERRGPADQARRPMKIAINGQEVLEQLDVAEKAAGQYRPLDMTFEEIRPAHGVIEIRLSAPVGEAILQSLELLPQASG